MVLDIMGQARDAIKAYEFALTVSSSNIAGMGELHIGFKRQNISFQSIFERVLNSGSAADTLRNFGGANPLQLGSSVAIADTNFDFADGTRSSADPINLAIAGSGLFMVSSDGGSTYQYTRAGNFQVIGGNLYTAAGMQVYGLNSSGTLVPIAGLAGNSSNYSWNNATGELLYNGAATGFRIALTYFSNPGGLAQASGTTFRETLASGSAATATAPGGAAGVVFGSSLEQSNVIFSDENIKSLEIQRVLSAQLSVVKAASDLISSVINKLG